jgi:hypothetical protein
MADDIFVGSLEFLLESFPTYAALTLSSVLSLFRLPMK